jgi:hypothetical protein
VNSSSQIEGGKIRAPPITNALLKLKIVYLCRLKLGQEKLSRRLSRLYQSALQLGEEGLKMEFGQL